MKYKLLALDLDCTLLSTDKSISEKNRTAIKKALQLGTKVVFITGRSVTSTYPVWNDIISDDVCVCFGGAVIMNMRTSEVLYSSIVAPELVTEALYLAEELSLHSQIYVGDHTVYREYCPRCERYERILHIRGETDPDILNKRWENIPKVLYFVTPDRIEELHTLVSKHFEGRLAVSTSADDLIEINHISTSKGDALLRVCDMLNISPEETIAMGDSMLDLSMLESAGLGIAMANSTPKLFEHIKTTAPSNNDDAVAYVIDKYILN